MSSRLAIKIICFRFGTLTWPDGDSYVGAWEGGLRQGWGAYYWNNGNSYQVSNNIMSFYSSVLGKGGGKCDGRPSSALQMGRWSQVPMHRVEGLLQTRLDR